MTNRGTMGLSRIKDRLMNPVYDGFIQRCNGETPIVAYITHVDDPSLIVGMQMAGQNYWYPLPGVPVDQRWKVVRYASRQFLPEIHKEARTVPVRVWLKAGWRSLWKRT